MQVVPVGKAQVLLTILKMASLYSCVPVNHDIRKHMQVKRVCAALLSCCFPSIMPILFYTGICACVYKGQRLQACECLSPRYYQVSVLQFSLADQARGVPLICASKSAHHADSEGSVALRLEMMFEFNLKLTNQRCFVH